MINGAITNKFMRDDPYSSPIAKLNIEVWEDGSSKAKIGEVDLTNFVKAMRHANLSIDRIVKMLREAAVLIESGIV